MTGWEDGEVEGNGLGLRYHRTGGNNPAVVLLHGITDNGLCWTRVARDLEGRFDLVMPDARGHGRSGGIEAGFSVDLLAGDVAVLIGALGLDRPVLYGHSMGAVTALVVAAHYPDLVRAIVLEDPPLYRLGEEPTEQRHAEARRWLLGLRQLPREERICYAMVENPDWAEEEIVPYAESKGEMVLEVMDHWRLPAIYPWREPMARIECPILLITGDPERGAIVTPEIAHEVKALAQTVRVARIAGAGHAIHRNRYEETLAAALPFLAAHSD